YDVPEEPQSSKSSAPSIFPEILEAFRRQLGVPHRVLDVLVAEVVLQRARIDALVRQLVAASVPQHVWMDGERHLGGLAEAQDQLLEAVRRHRCSPLAHEHIASWPLLALQPA